MKIKLSENIRSFRKQRHLTQEQLAEILNVTTGAVYKWEAKLSVPELQVIIKLADFFDTSVDDSKKSCPEIWRCHHLCLSLRW